jgi:putative FmdB family regulatory protein
MPTYQYECKDCSNQFEQFQKFSDDPLTVCPSCEGSVRRVIQNVGVVFKGSGWYITDSRGGSKDKSSSDSASTDKPAAEAPVKAETSTKSESAATPAPATAT